MGTARTPPDLQGSLGRSAPHARRAGLSEAPQCARRLRRERRARVLWTVPAPVRCAPHPCMYRQPLPDALIRGRSPSPPPSLLTETLLRPCALRPLPPPAQDQLPTNPAGGPETARYRKAGTTPQSTPGTIRFGARSQRWEQESWMPSVGFSPLATRKPDAGPLWAVVSPRVARGSRSRVSAQGGEGWRGRPATASVLNQMECGSHSRRAPPPLRSEVRLWRARNL